MFFFNNYAPYLILVKKFAFIPVNSVYRFPAGKCLYLDLISLTLIFFDTEFPFFIFFSIFFL